jgi:hypothetical protein
MSDPFTMNGPGLPSQILHALTPRPIPVDPPQPSHRIKPPPAPSSSGAHFSSTRQDVTGRGDEQLLSELRSLAELHRAHQAARANAGNQGQESSKSE